MSDQRATERFDVIVIGCGQAGLAAGNELARLGLWFMMLDANPRVGDSWRNRWDTLRLFTPAWYDSLPRRPFPAPRHSYPGKDAVADYFETYAQSTGLPVLRGHTVEELRPAEGGSGYFVRAGARWFEADQVIVATGAYHHPRIPGLAADLDPGIRQLHSRDYRRPGQLQEGGVLVVGASNSGAEIALDVAPSHRTWLSGRDPGELPFGDSEGLIARVLSSVMIFGATHVLTRGNPIGRRAIAGELSRGTPVERAKATKLRASGVERVLARTVGVRDGLPLLDDGRVMEVTNVIWATGFQPEFSWIRLPIFGDDGWPIQWRGVVDTAPGLYFIGLPFMYSLSSAFIGGVARDAAYLARRIADRVKVVDPRSDRRAPALADPTR